MQKTDRSVKAARSFGLTFGTLAALVALWRWWRGFGAIAAWFGLGALALILIAWASPRWLDLPNRLWMRLARALGWVNSRVLLTLVFVFVVTPYGMLQRWLGRDAIGRQWRAAPPRWIPAPDRLRNPDHYDHLY